MTPIMTIIFASALLAVVRRRQRRHERKVRLERMSAQVVYVERTRRPGLVGRLLGKW